jgi:nitroreductase
MELHQVIMGRRSIRKYADRDVSDEQIKALLEAAYWAPRVNERWNFIVVRDKATKEVLAKGEPGAKPQSHAAAAPVDIVVCIDLRGASKRDRELFAMQEASAAIQNILLKAYELGLGTCWIGSFDDDAVTEALSLPEGVKPIAIISIGYPAEEGKGIRRKKLHEIVHWERWGNTGF